MIETDRLILRQWREDDAPALYRYASDPRVSELALWPCHTSVDMSRDVIRDIFRPNPHCFAMVLKESGEAVGCIGLVPRGGEHFAAVEGGREVGYWIGLPHWDRGLTTEALKAFIKYCRDELNIRRLTITTDAANTASQCVAAKCGFAFVKDFNYQGIDSKYYRLEI